MFDWGAEETGPERARGESIRRGALRRSDSLTGSYKATKPNDDLIALVDVARCVRDTCSLRESVACGSRSLSA